jgi:hypothetical protein
MTDAPDNLVIDQLRHIRADMSGLRDDVRDLILRVGHVEEGVARLGVQMAEQSVRLDRIGTRLDRIDTRDGLIGA